MRDREVKHVIPGQCKYKQAARHDRSEARAYGRMQEAVHVMGAWAGGGRSGCGGLSPGVHVRCTALGEPKRIGNKSALVQCSGPGFHTRVHCAAAVLEQLCCTLQTSRAHFGRSRSSERGTLAPKQAITSASGTVSARCP